MFYAEGKESICSHQEVYFICSNIGEQGKESKVSILIWNKRESIYSHYEERESIGSHLE